jgi:hypothetical protein
MAMGGIHATYNQFANDKCMMYHIKANDVVEAEKLPSIISGGKGSFAAVYDNDDKVYLVGGCYSHKRDKYTALKTCERYNVNN